MDDRNLSAAQRAFRQPPSSHPIRDALLGWIGTTVIALLVLAIFSSGPTDRGERSAQEARDTLERK